MKIALTGGGTLGHVFPALTVAKALKKLSAESDFLYIGSHKEQERDCVEKAGIRFFAVPSGKLRRYFSLQTIPDAFRVVGGFFASFQVLRKERPDVLFSKGGYVSVPVVFASYVLRIPVVSHESDYSLGLANRINARFSRKVCLSFPLEKRDAHDTWVLTGNPVRDAILNPVPAHVEEPCVLVLGGSQGAEEINKLVYAHLSWLTERCHVYHQAGKRGDYSIHQDRYTQVPFIGDELGYLLQKARVVISRAGAGALSEIIACHTPALLLPLGTNASRGDQILNARFYQKQGMVAILEHAEDFEAQMSVLLRDTVVREQMIEKMQEADFSQNSEKIARIVLQEGERK